MVVRWSAGDRLVDPDTRVLRKARRRACRVVDTFAPRRCRSSVCVVGQGRVKRCTGGARRDRDGDNDGAAFADHQRVGSTQQIAICRAPIVGTSGAWRGWDDAVDNEVAGTKDCIEIIGGLNVEQVNVAVVEDVQRVAERESAILIVHRASRDSLLEANHWIFRERGRCFSWIVDGLAGRRGSDDVGVVSERRVERCAGCADGNGDRHRDGAGFADSQNVVAIEKVAVGSGAVVGTKLTWCGRHDGVHHKVASAEDSIEVVGHLHVAQFDVAGVRNIEGVLKGVGAVGVVRWSRRDRLVERDAWVFAEVGGCGVAVRWSCSAGRCARANCEVGVVLVDADRIGVICVHRDDDVEQDDAALTNGDGVIAVEHQVSWRRSESGVPRIDFTWCGRRAACADQGGAKHHVEAIKHLCIPQLGVASVSNVNLILQAVRAVAVVRWRLRQCLDHVDRRVLVQTGRRVIYIANRVCWPRGWLAKRSHLVHVGGAGRSRTGYIAVGNENKVDSHHAASERNRKRVVAVEQQHIRKGAGVASCNIAWPRDHRVRDRGKRGRTKDSPKIVGELHVAQFAIAGVGHREFVGEVPGSVAIVDRTEYDIFDDFDGCIFGELGAVGS